MAACPSGALRAEGFQAAPEPTRRTTVHVDCSRSDDAAHEALMRMPCLGGVSVVQLLSWWLAAGDAVLRFIDHGWCEHCPVGGGGFAARDVVQQANAWLADCGVASEHLVQIMSGPRAPAQAYRPATTDQPPVSRRAFLRRVSSEPAWREPDAGPPEGPRAAWCRDPVPLPAREALLQLLQTIADRHGRALPERALPSIDVAARCTDDGVCAGSCPTGALVRREEGDALSLSFDAARCVACGRCEAVCAQGALRLGQGGTTGSTTVHQRRLRDCLQCGASFVPSADDTLCPRCLAHRRLAGAMFGTRVADSHGS